MPRKAREWHEHACYHITCRGNHRNDLFRDESDFGMYLILLGDVLKHFKDTPFHLVSYCLMDNHVHLLIQTTTRHIGLFMKRLNMNYAIYFNKKYNYIGHLFQDRFFSELIATDTQLLETSRYIHLNPVRAQMVPLPQDYPWSSYPYLIGVADTSCINPSYIWRYFPEDRATTLYQEFVESKLNLRKEATDGNCYS
ncbi:MAG: transposase [Cellulosilyticaceae bacterium]